MKSYCVILINQVISFTRRKYNTFFHNVKRIFKKIRYFFKLKKNPKKAMYNLIFFTDKKQKDVCKKLILFGSSKNIIRLLQ